MNLPPPSPMYSDPNEPLLRSVTPPPSSPLLGRARWLWSKLTFALDRRACALLSAVGLRDADAREAGSLVLVTLSVAGLALGLYFAVPTLHPMAAREVATAARAVRPPAAPAEGAATKSALPPPPAPAPSLTAAVAIAHSNGSAWEGEVEIDDDVSSQAMARGARQDDGALEPPRAKAKAARSARSAKSARSVKAARSAKAAKARALAGARAVRKVRALAQRRATAASRSSVAEDSTTTPRRTRGTDKPSRRSKRRQPAEIAQR